MLKVQKATLGTFKIEMGHFIKPCIICIIELVALAKKIDCIACAKCWIPMYLETCLTEDVE